MATLPRLVMCIGLGLIAAGLSSYAQEGDAKRARAGDYTAWMTADGLHVAYKGEAISIGSYFNLFVPEYKGTVVSYRDGYAPERVSLSADRRTLTLEAKLDKGNFTYSATVSEKGVRVTVRVATADDAAVGPVEYAWFKIPPPLVKDATVEVRHVSGTVLDSKPVPSEPKRGSMARSGDALLIKTPTRNILVTARSLMNLYPFDARVKQYGKTQGLWAFAGISHLAGYEKTSVVELTVLPPDPVPGAGGGTILLTRGVPATGVATLPNPGDREKMAADELVAYLARMTGKKLPRIEIAGGSVPRGVIAVGRLAKTAGLISNRDLEAVRRDGYVVRVSRGRAGICGWRDLGTAYGVYALLKHLGVRFYAEGCEIVPKTRKLTIGRCRLRVKPPYEFRRITRGRKGITWKLGNTPDDDMGNPRELGERGGFVHSADYLLSFDKFHEEHPEYFALHKDGKRLHHKPGETRFDVHLCFSNPDVRRISAERLLAWIEKQKDRTFFGASQGDGHSWCVCEKCRALDPVAGEMTDRLLFYVNEIAREVAKKYPDKVICTLAYTNATSPPPREIMPEPNVMVQYCPYPRRTNCQSHYFTCPQNRQGFEDLKGWIAKCPNNMYIFDYPRGYKYYYQPFGSFYAMKQKLDFYAANGIRGIYYCGVPTNFTDLFVFVNSRLLWEPHADAEALIDEFMPAYYRKAAPAMREYFDFLHSQVEERQFHQMCEGSNPGLVTAEYAEKAYDMFRRAEAAAADDQPALYRVRREKFCVLFADLDERNLVNGKLAVGRDKFAERLAEFIRIARSMRVWGLIRRKPPAQWLYRVARIRITAKTWYADPLLDKLVADPVKALSEIQAWFLQKEIPGGWRIELDGFVGCHGPEIYAYDCPARRAVWFYGRKKEADPVTTMRAFLRLDKAPQGKSSLTLLAQDDDKPGSVSIRVSINAKEIFSGPNPFKEHGWSNEVFPIPPGVLKGGRNEIEFAILDVSPARDAKWFMLAECKVLLENAG